MNRAQARGQKSGNIELRTQRKVMNIGKSRVVCLPPRFCKRHGIDYGDSVVISYGALLTIDPAEVVKK